MKFVKRISTFFILPMIMFALGFASDMAIQEFFYPGRNTPAKQQEYEEEYQELSASVPVALAEEPVINADTVYVVQEYDGASGDIQEMEEKIPGKYIGLSRDLLIKEIEKYNLSPSLNDLEKGFESCEVVSFSQKRVVLRKTYVKEEMPEGYYLMNEGNYVTVYYADRETVYLNTNILTETLPDHLQLEIINVKFIAAEEELYNFLEAYSS